MWSEDGVLGDVAGQGRTGRGMGRGTVIAIGGIGQGIVVREIGRGTAVRVSVHGIGRGRGR